MKVEIKGENLQVYCKGWDELEKFTKLNNVICLVSGAFEWKEYFGERTFSDEHWNEFIFWFLPEHLPELKFN